MRVFSGLGIFRSVLTLAGATYGRKGEKEREREREGGEKERKRERASTAGQRQLKWTELGARWIPWKALSKTRPRVERQPAGLN